jgi:DNA-binding transcriptional LysR family regulator
VTARPLPDNELPHLETFSKAAELSSFTDAAKALNLTQAAVSQRIHVLEKTLGKSLFQRRGGRVLLSDAGKKLYDYAQRILELHQSARQAVSGVEMQVAGELRLAASSIPGEHLLPGLLAAFRREYPHIQVRALVSDSATVLAQVEHGQVDLGLVGQKADNPHLEFQFFAKDHMVAVVAARHPLTRRKKVSLKDLVRFPLVLREVGSGLRHAFETSLERAGLTSADLQVAMELGSNQAVKEAVRQGVGIAVLSAFALEKELKTGRLRAIPIADLRGERDLYVVQDRRRVVPAPARMFLSFLETHPLRKGKA